MTVEINYEAEEKLHIPYRKIITKAVEACIEAEKCPYEAEVSVVLTDNERIRELNREFRNIDRPTDVLSFPMCDYDKPGDFDWLEEHGDDCFHPETGELRLGDIVISVEKVREQAESYGHPEARELAFLVAHSMLHLFGYDHMEEEERAVMEKKQEEILAGKGYTR